VDTCIKNSIAEHGGVWVLYSFGQLFPIPSRHAGSPLQLREAFGRASWLNEVISCKLASCFNTPELTGDTGMGELGLSLKPSKDLPLSFDLGVQGYVGKREGVTGSLQIRYEF